jgi:hypothetical protein
VSGPLEAARTADLLIERGFPSVRGDQDRILVELWQAGTSTRSDFRQLERKHFDWMASMPPTLMYRGQVFLCHASPRGDADFWLDYITNDGGVRASPIEAVEAAAEGIDAQVILCGHTRSESCSSEEWANGRKSRQRWIAGLRRTSACSVRGRGRHTPRVLCNFGPHPSGVVRHDPVRTLRQRAHG